MYTTFILKPFITNLLLLYFVSDISNARLAAIMQDEGEVCTSYYFYVIVLLLILQAFHRCLHLLVITEHICPVHFLLLSLL